MEELEARIADLERIAPAQAASYRERLHQRLAAHIEESIHRPRLQPEDVAQLEDLLRALDQRKPEAAAPLRQALNKRLRMWEPVFELAAPYTALPDGLDPKHVRVEEGGLIISATVAARETTAQPPRRRRLLTRIACGGNVRAEVDFDDSWPSATELGLVLNAEEERTDAAQPQPKVRGAGYTFLLRKALVSSADGTSARPRASTLSTANSAWSSSAMASRCRARGCGSPSGPLHLSAGREGNRLLFQVNDLPPLVFQDVFPLRQGGVFGLCEWTGARLRSWHAWRLAQPATASLLEQGDDRFDRGHYAESLRCYRQQAATAGSGRAVTDEAHYKEGLCLTALRRPAEAVTLFERLAAEAEPRWSILASCQLWLLHLRQNRFDEANVFFETLAARYRFEELAASIPDEVRQNILRVYSEQTTHVNLFKPDPRRVPQRRARRRRGGLLQSPPASSRPTPGGILAEPTTRPVSWTKPSPCARRTCSPIRRPTWLLAS